MGSVELGWVGLIWVGFGWVWLIWIVLLLVWWFGLVGLIWVGLVWVGLGWVELDWVRSGLQTRFRHYFLFEIVIRLSNLNQNRIELTFRQKFNLLGLIR